MRRIAAVLSVLALLALSGCISAGGNSFPINPPGGRTFWVGFQIQTTALEGVGGNYVNIEVDSHGSNGPGVGTLMPMEKIAYPLPAEGYEFPVTILADYHGTVVIDGTMTYAGLPRGKAGERAKCYIRDAQHNAIDVDVAVLAARAVPIQVHCTASFTF